MNRAYFAVPALCAAMVATSAAAQTVQPTVRKIADIGEAWISGIVDTRNGRFLVYSTADSIFVRDRRTGATQSTAARVASLVNNSLGVSASGDRIAFLSYDDQQNGPFVWTLGIDTVTGRAVGTARRVGIEPAIDPSVSPDGQRIAYVQRRPGGNLISGGLRLMTIPAGGGEPTVVIDAGGRYRIAAPRWSPDGSTIYYQVFPPAPSLGTGPSVWRVRATGGRPDSLFRVNLLNDVSPDGRYVALFPASTNWQQTTRPMYSVTTSSGTTLGTFVLPHTARPYSWSRTGEARIYAVMSVYPSAVRTVSLADGGTSTVSSTHQFPRKGRYAPNGSGFAYQARINDRYQFILVDARGREQILSTRTEPDGFYSWSPDGNWIAFIGATEGRWLNIVNVTTGVERQLVNLAPGRNFRWRSDSRALFFVAPPASGPVPTEIGMASVDGRLSRAGSAPRSMVPGDWIALVNDSTYIYRHGEGTGRQLFAVSMSSGSQRLIYTGLVSSDGAVLSPDGKWVAFTTAPPDLNAAQLVRASLDGRENRRIGPPMACGAGAMTFHPDGKHLLAWAYPGCEGAAYREVLYLLSLNGDAPRQLTDDSGGHGSWSYSLSPDGRSILFDQSDGKSMRSLAEFDLGSSLSGRGGSARRSP